MSNMKNLIRSAMESADAAGDVPAPIYPIDQITEENADAAVAGALEQFEQLSGSADELDESIDSHLTAVDGLESLASALESYDARPVSTTIGPIALGLESALAPVSNPQFTQEMVQEITTQIQQQASDSQDAAKGVREKARTIFQRLVAFLRELWRKLTRMMATIFNAIIGVKAQVKRFNARVNARNLSITPREESLSLENPQVKTIFQNLSWKGQFAPSAVALLDGLHQAQLEVNSLDTTFTDRYALDMERLTTGLQTGHPEWIKEMANGQIPVPKRFTEVKAEKEGSRVWLSGQIPGGHQLRLAQDVVQVGPFKAIGYDVSLVTSEPPSYPDSIPLLPVAELPKIGEKILKILDETKNGKSLVERAAQVNEKVSRKPPLSPTGVSLVSLFHRRYKAVSRLSTRMNSVILKVALSTLAWGDQTLALYPEKG